MKGKKFEFSDEQIKYIIDHWGIESIHSMKKMFNCSWYAIANIGKKYNLKLPESNKWTDDDIDKLVEYSKEYDLKTIAKMMNRSENAVFLKANRLNIPLYKNKRKWTREEEELLQELWGTISIESLSKKLNRSIYSLKVKAIRLGLGAMIYNNTEVLTISDIVDILNVTRDRISTWNKYGLKINNKRVTNNYTYYYVKWEDLIAFLKNNQDLWDSTNVDLYMLGEEYDWLTKKRIRDRSHKPLLYRKWSNNEKDMALYYFRTGHSYEEIAQLINRSEWSIRNFLNNNGFYVSDRKKWTVKEEQYLKDNLNFMTYKEIADNLNKSLEQVEYKVYKEGLKKVRALKK